MSKPPFTMSKYANINDLLTDKAKYYKSRSDNFEAQVEAIKGEIHYPDCWDTAAYPTLISAVREIGCNPDCCTKTLQCRKDKVK